MKKSWGTRIMVFTSHRSPLGGHKQIFEGQWFPHIFFEVGIKLKILSEIMPHLIGFFSKLREKGEEKTCRKCEMRRAGQDVTPDIRHTRSCPDKHLEKKTYSKKCEYCDKIIVMNMKR